MSTSPVSDYPSDENSRTVDYPPLSEELGGNWASMIRAFGPGIIAASVTVATGETIFAPRMGAIFGYTMLWVVTLTVLFKAVQVYTGARYLVLTGEHPMQAWARLPGPRAWLPILIGLVAIISFPLWIAALSDALSSLLVWVTGIGGSSSRGRTWWGTGIIIAAMTFTLLQTYNIIERASLVILSLKLILVFVAVVIVKPDWLAVLWGLFVPQMAEHQPWIVASYPEIASRTVWLEIAVLMGTVGGGVQDYVGYVGLMREKHWGAADRHDNGPVRFNLDPETVTRGRAWLRAPLFDTLFSFGSVLLITMCFMILGAAVLHPRGLVPTNADLYSQQSQFLGLIHPRLVMVYKAGIFFAIFGAMYGAFELYTRTVDEPLQAIWPRHSWSLKQLRVAVTLFSGGGGLLLLWTGWKTVALASIISPLSGVFGCGLWCWAMIWVDRKLLPEPYRMKKPLLVLTLLAAAAMTVIGSYVTVGSWWG